MLEEGDRGGHGPITGRSARGEEEDEWGGKEVKEEEEEPAQNSTRQVMTWNKFYAQILDASKKTKRPDDLAPKIFAPLVQIDGRKQQI
jgi:hypothetical protein